MMASSSNASALSSGVSASPWRSGSSVMSESCQPRRRPMCRQNSMNSPVHESLRSRRIWRTSRAWSDLRFVLAIRRSFLSRAVRTMGPGDCTPYREEAVPGGGRWGRSGGGGERARRGRAGGLAGTGERGRARRGRARRWVFRNWSANRDSSIQRAQSSTVARSNTTSHQTRQAIRRRATQSARPSLRTQSHSSECDWREHREPRDRQRSASR